MINVFLSSFSSNTDISTAECVLPSRLLVSAMIESLSWFRSFSVFEDNVMSSILALTLKSSSWSTHDLSRPWDHILAAARSWSLVILDSSAGPSWPLTKTQKITLVTYLFYFMNCKLTNILLLVPCASLTTTFLSPEFWPSLALRIKSFNILPCQIYVASLSRSKTYPH